jgi:hypothetical protein
MSGALPSPMAYQLMSDDRLSDDWQAPSAVIASIATAKRSQLADAHAE